MDTPASAWSFQRMASSFLPRNLGILALISLSSCATTVEIEEAGATTGSAPDGGPAILPPAARVFAGGDDTCVVSAAGHVACWGSNESGQLGLGDLVDRRTPAWIPGLDHVVDLAVGDFSMCAQKTDGAVVCWGSNYYGELRVETDACPGLGYACSTVPVDTGVKGAARLGAGYNGYCAALTPEGALECWGAGWPWDVPGYHALSVTGGNGFLCVTFEPAAGEDPTRNVICAGYNTTGQLGSGEEYSYDPGPIAEGVPGGFVEIASGDEFTCGVGAGGQLSCWGSNEHGELGLGFSDTADYPETCVSQGAQVSCATQPTHVPPAPPIAHFAADMYQACALTTAGDVYCWGTPSHTSPASASPCGATNPDCKSVPQLIHGVAKATSIGVGHGHACAVTAGGAIACWGLDTHGQLGRGDGPSFEATPVVAQLPAEPL